MEGIIPVQTQLAAMIVYEMMDTRKLLTFAKVNVFKTVMLHNRIIIVCGHTIFFTCHLIVTEVTAHNMSLCGGSLCHKDAECDNTTNLCMCVSGYTGDGITECYSKCRAIYFQG